MNANWISKNRSMALGLLGATVIFGSPISAQADQGKWWNPERGGRQSDARSEAYRPPAWRGSSSYRQGPRFSRDAVRNANRRFEIPMGACILM